MRLVALSCSRASDVPDVSVGPQTLSRTSDVPDVSVGGVHVSVGVNAGVHVARG